MLLLLGFPTWQRQTLLRKSILAGSFLMTLCAKLFFEHMEYTALPMLLHGNRASETLLRLWFICAPVILCIEISVLFVAIVHAGFAGSRRARCNFIRVELILSKRHVSVVVFNEYDGQLRHNDLGSGIANCLGLLHLEHDTKHVSVFPPICSDFPCTCPQVQAPWHRQCAGGRKATAKKYTTCCQVHI